MVLEKITIKKRDYCLTDKLKRRKHSMNDLKNQLINEDGSINGEMLIKIGKELTRLKKRNEELELDNAIKTQRLAEATSKATYYDKILACDKSMSTEVVAGDYGLSENAFNNLLCDLEIQYKRGDIWLLNKAFSAKGYTRLESWCSDKAIEYGIKWTQKGRLFLYETLKNFGILPLMEQRNDKH